MGGGPGGAPRVGALWLCCEVYTLGPSELPGLPMPAPVIKLEHHERVTAAQLDAISWLAWVPRAMARTPERKRLFNHFDTDPCTYTFVERLPFGLFDVRVYSFAGKYNFIAQRGRFATIPAMEEAQASMAALRGFSGGAELVARTLEYVQADDVECYLDLTQSVDERWGPQGEELAEPRQVAHLTVVK